MRNFELLQDRGGNVAMMFAILRRRPRLHLYHGCCRQALHDARRSFYTIAFEVDDADTQEMLNECATSSDSFFNADNAADLTDPFGEIGNNLQELALTK